MKLIGGIVTKKGIFLQTEECDVPIEFIEQLNNEKPKINVNYNIDSLFPEVDSDADRKVDKLLRSQADAIANIIKKNINKQVR